MAGFVLGRVCDGCEHRLHDLPFPQKIFEAAKVPFGVDFSHIKSAVVVIHPTQLVGPLRRGAVTVDIDDVEIRLRYVFPSEWDPDLWRAKAVKRAKKAIREWIASVSLFGPQTSSRGGEFKIRMLNSMVINCRNVHLHIVDNVCSGTPHALEAIIEEAKISCPENGDPRFKPEEMAGIQALTLRVLWIRLLGMHITYKEFPGPALVDARSQWLEKRPVREKLPEEQPLPAPVESSDDESNEVWRLGSDRVVESFTGVTTRPEGLSSVSSFTLQSEAWDDSSGVTTATRTLDTQASKWEAPRIEEEPTHQQAFVGKRESTKGRQSALPFNDHGLRVSPPGGMDMHIISREWAIRALNDAELDRWKATEVGFTCSEKGDPTPHFENPDAKFTPLELYFSSGAFDGLWTLVSHLRFWSAFRKGIDAPLKQVGTKYSIRKFHELIKRQKKGQPLTPDQEKFVEETELRLPNHVITSVHHKVEQEILIHDASFLGRLGNRIKKAMAGRKLDLESIDHRWFDNESRLTIHMPNVVFQFLPELKRGIHPQGRPLPGFKPAGASKICGSSSLGMTPVFTFRFTFRMMDLKRNALRKGTYIALDDLVCLRDEKEVLCVPFHRAVNIEPCLQAFVADSCPRELLITRTINPAELVLFLRGGQNKVVGDLLQGVSAKERPFWSRVLHRVIPPCCEQILEPDHIKVRRRDEYDLPGKYDESSTPTDSSFCKGTTFEKRGRLYLVDPFTESFLGSEPLVHPSTRFAIILENSTAASSRFTEIVVPSLNLNMNGLLEFMSAFPPDIPHCLDFFDEVDKPIPHKTIGILNLAASVTPWVKQMLLEVPHIMICSTNQESLECLRGQDAGYRRATEKWKSRHLGQDDRREGLARLSAVNSMAPPLHSARVVLDDFSFTMDQRRHKLHVKCRNLVCQMLIDASAFFLRLSPLLGRHDGPLACDSVNRPTSTTRSTSSAVALLDQMRAPEGSYVPETPETSSLYLYGDRRVAVKLLSVSCFEFEDIGRPVVYPKAANFPVHDAMPQVIATSLPRREAATQTEDDLPPLKVDTKRRPTKSLRVSVAHIQVGLHPILALLAVNWSSWTFDDVDFRYLLYRLKAFSPWRRIDPVTNSEFVNPKYSYTRTSLEEASYVILHGVGDQPHEDPLDALLGALETGGFIKAAFQSADQPQSGESQRPVSIQTGMRHVKLGVGVDLSRMRLEEILAIWDDDHDFRNDMYWILAELEHEPEPPPKSAVLKRLEPQTASPEPAALALELNLGTLGVMVSEMQSHVVLVASLFGVTVDLAKWTKCVGVDLGCSEVFILGADEDYNLLTLLSKRVGHLASFNAESVRGSGTQLLEGLRTPRMTHRFYGHEYLEDESSDAPTQTSISSVGFDFDSTASESFSSDSLKVSSSCTPGRSRSSIHLNSSLHQELLREWSFPSFYGRPRFFRRASFASAWKAESSRSAGTGMAQVRLTRDDSLSLNVAVTLESWHLFPVLRLVDQALQTFEDVKSIMAVERLRLEGNRRLNNRSLETPETPKTATQAPGPKQFHLQVHTTDVNVHLPSGPVLPAGFYSEVGAAEAEAFSDVLFDAARTHGRVPLLVPDTYGLCLNSKLELGTSITQVYSNQKRVQITVDLESMEVLLHQKAVWLRMCLTIANARFRTHFITGKESFISGLVNASLLVQKVSLWGCRYLNVARRKAGTTVDESESGSTSVSPTTVVGLFRTSEKPTEPVPFYTPRFGLEETHPHIKDEAWLNPAVLALLPSRVPFPSYHCDSLVPALTPLVFCVSEEVPSLTVAVASEEDSPIHALVSCAHLHLVVDMASFKRLAEVVEFVEDWAGWKHEVPASDSVPTSPRKPDHFKPVSTLLSPSSGVTGAVRVTVTGLSAVFSPDLAVATAVPGPTLAKCLDGNFPSLQLYDVLRINENDPVSFRVDTEFYVQGKEGLSRDDDLDDMTATIKAVEPLVVGLGLDSSAPFLRVKPASHRDSRLRRFVSMGSLFNGPRRSMEMGPKKTVRGIWVSIPSVDLQMQDNGRFWSLGVRRTTLTLDRVSDGGETGIDSFFYQMEFGIERLSFKDNLGVPFLRRTPLTRKKHPQNLMSSAHFPNSYVQNLQFFCKCLYKPARYKTVITKVQCMRLELEFDSMHRLIVRAKQVARTLHPSIVVHQMEPPELPWHRDMHASTLKAGAGVYSATRMEARHFPLVTYWPATGEECYVQKGLPRMEDMKWVLDFMGLLPNQGDPVESEHLTPRTVAEDTSAFKPLLGGLPQSTHPLNRFQDVDEYAHTWLSLDAEELKRPDVHPREEKTYRTSNFGRSTMVPMSIEKSAVSDSASISSRRRPKWTPDSKASYIFGVMAAVANTVAGHVHFLTSSVIGSGVQPNALLIRLAVEGVEGWLVPRCPALYRKRMQQSINVPRGRTPVVSVSTLSPQQEEKAVPLAAYHQWFGPFQPDHPRPGFHISGSRLKGDYEVRMPPLSVRRIKETNKERNVSFHALKPVHISENPLMHTGRADDNATGKQVLAVQICASVTCLKIDLPTSTVEEEYSRRYLVQAKVSELAVTLGTPRLRHEDQEVHHDGEGVPVLVSSDGRLLASDRDYLLKLERLNIRLYGHDARAAGDDAREDHRALLLKHYSLDGNNLDELGDTSFWTASVRLNRLLVNGTLSAISSLHDIIDTTTKQVGAINEDWRRQDTTCGSNSIEVARTLLRRDVMRVENPSEAFTFDDSDASQHISRDAYLFWKHDPEVFQASMGYEATKGLASQEHAIIDFLFLRLFACPNAVPLINVNFRFLETTVTLSDFYTTLSTLHIPLIGGRCSYPMLGKSDMELKVVKFTVTCYNPQQNKTDTVVAPFSVEASISRSMQQMRPHSDETVPKGQCSVTIDPIELHVFSGVLQVFQRVQAYLVRLDKAMRVTQNKKPVLKLLNDTQTAILLKGSMRAGAHVVVPEGQYAGVSSGQGLEVHLYLPPKKKTEKTPLKLFKRKTSEHYSTEDLTLSEVDTDLVVRSILRMGERRGDVDVLTSVDRYARRFMLHSTRASDALLKMLYHELTKLSTNSKVHNQTKEMNRILSKPGWTAMGGLRKDYQNTRAYFARDIGFSIVAQPDTLVGVNGQEEWFVTLGTCIQIHNSTALPLGISTVKTSAVRGRMRKLVMRMTGFIEGSLKDMVSKQEPLVIPPFSSRSIPLMWFHHEDCYACIRPETKTPSVAGLEESWYVPFHLLNRLLDFIRAENHSMGHDPTTPSRPQQLPAQVQLKWRRAVAVKGLLEVTQIPSNYPSCHAYLYSIILRPTVSVTNRLPYPVTVCAHPTVEGLAALNRTLRPNSGVETLFRGHMADAEREVTSLVTRGMLVATIPPLCVWGLTTAESHMEMVFTVHGAPIECLGNTANVSQCTEVNHDRSVLWEDILQHILISEEPLTTLPYPADIASFDAMLLRVGQGTFAERLISPHSDADPASARRLFEAYISQYPMYTTTAVSMWVSGQDAVNSHQMNPRLRVCSDVEPFPRQVYKICEKAMCLQDYLKGDQMVPPTIASRASSMGFVADDVRTSAVNDLVNEMYSTLPFIADAGKGEVTLFSPYQVENSSLSMLTLNGKIVPPMCRLMICEDEARRARIRAFRLKNSDAKKLLVVCSNRSVKMDLQRMTQSRPAVVLKFPTQDALDKPFRPEMDNVRTIKESRGETRRIPKLCRRKRGAGSIASSESTEKGTHERVVKYRAAIVKASNRVLRRRAPTILSPRLDRRDAVSHNDTVEGELMSEDSLLVSRPESFTAAYSNRDITTPRHDYSRGFRYKNVDGVVSLGITVRYNDHPYGLSKVVSIAPRYVFYSRLPFAVSVEEFDTRAKVTTKQLVMPSGVVPFHMESGAFVLCGVSSGHTSSPFVMPDAAPHTAQVALMHRGNRDPGGIMLPGDGLIVQINVVSGEYKSSHSLPSTVNTNYVVLSVAKSPKYQLVNHCSVPLLLEEQIPGRRRPVRNAVVNSNIFDRGRRESRPPPSGEVKRVGSEDRMKPHSASFYRRKHSHSPVVPQPDNSRSELLLPGASCFYFSSGGDPSLVISVPNSKTSERWPVKFDNYSSVSSLAYIAEDSDGQSMSYIHYALYVNHSGTRIVVFLPSKTLASRILKGENITAGMLTRDPVGVNMNSLLLSTTKTVTMTSGVRDAAPPTARRERDEIYSRTNIDNHHLPFVVLSVEVILGSVAVKWIHQSDTILAFRLSTIRFSGSLGPETLPGWLGAAVESRTKRVKLKHFYDSVKIRIFKTRQEAADPVVE